MSRDAARQILEVFKEGAKFHTLRDLAKQAGFGTAASRGFKAGFNRLIDEGIIVLQQSGWRSEKRGGNNHPKKVILNADLYQLIGNEYSLDKKAAEEASGYVSNPRERSKPLSQSLIERLQKCPQCASNPVVYITNKQIPVCAKHWDRLAESSIEWVTLGDRS